jgi:hypothetical protein
MVFNRRSLLIVSCAAVGLALGRAEAGDWRRYSNGRYGFSIEYPPQFRAEPEPANGDGRDFTSSDGAEFSVSGELNNPGDEKRTIAEFEAYLRGGDADYSNVTYRAIGADSLVLSGYRGDKVFYEKYIFSQNGQLINAFSVSYPTNMKAVYDPIVTRMARSFHPGTPLGNWK